MVDMYRTLDSIPVLAKAGGILVMTDEIRGTEAEKNPESLNIRVFPGADGSFRLYEDDNETCAYENGACVFTEMDYKEKDQAVFTIHPGQDVYKRQVAVILTLIAAAAGYNHWYFNEKYMTLENSGMYVKNNSLYSSNNLINRMKVQYTEDGKTEFVYAIDAPYLSLIHIWNHVCDRKWSRNSDPHRT